MVSELEQIQPYEGNNVWFRNGHVTQAKSYTRRFKISILLMIYKDKVAFLVSHISVMENNVYNHK